MNFSTLILAILCLSVVSFQTGTKGGSKGGKPRPTPEPEQQQQQEELEPDSDLPVGRPPAFIPPKPEHRPPNGQQGFRPPQGPSSGSNHGPPHGHPNGPPHGHPNGPPPGHPNGPPNGYPNGPPHGEPNGPPSGYPNGPPNGYPNGPPHGEPNGPPAVPPSPLGGLGALLNQMVSMLIFTVQRILDILGGILCDQFNALADVMTQMANSLGSGCQRDTFAINLFREFYARNAVTDTMGRIAKRLAQVLQEYLQKRENVGYIGVDSLSLFQ